MKKKYHNTTPQMINRITNTPKRCGLISGKPDFLFILLIWFITKIIKLFFSIKVSRKHTLKKESKYQNTRMDIMDADYEEVE